MSLSESADQPTDERNPIESIASDIVQSMREGEEVADRADDQPSELAELLPVIQRLERARRDQAARPNGLASLGSERPERLGDFQLVRQIGRGGMGVVFEAVQDSLGRHVAVKVLPKSLLADEVQLKRFQQEARTAASLHHTNIVPVHGVGEDQGFHYYVMQLIEGRGLDQWTSDSNIERLTVNEVAKLGQQAASAVAYAHSLNVLHRDIKPANLMVDDDKELWVTDFGVAKAIESEAVTRTGDVIGTLRYMAPEQIVGATDFRSDIYSLGVTFYELLAGRPAIDDASIRAAIVSRRPASTPPPLRQLNPDVPRDLETILQTAMSPHPSRRYQSAQTMADDFQRFLDGKSISVRRASSLEKAARWAKRNPAIASLAALSLLLLVGIAITSSVGYFQVQRVLNREQVARQNAEQTAQLATDAMNHVFDRFATNGDYSSQLSNAPALSLETAEVLEGLLTYFDRLEGRGHDDTKLAESNINARTAIGEIHFQLGHYQRAIDWSLLALEQARQSESITPLREAHIRNQIGYAHRLLSSGPEADQQHDLALACLELADKDDFEHRFELARTHFLYALQILPGMRPSSMPPRMVLNLDSDRDRERGPRSGPLRRDVPPGPINQFDGEMGTRPSPTQQAHLRRAIEIFRELRDQRPDHIGCSVALASCLHHLAGDSFVDRTNQESEHANEAINILSELHEQFPDHPTVLIELSNVLSGFTVFQKMSRDEHWNAVERCRKAVKYCDVLVASHPNVPNYNNALVHTLFRLGVMLERMSDREPNRRDLEDEARTAFRRAARAHAVLLRQHPDEVGYLAWNAVFLMRFGDLADRTGNEEEAETALKSSAKIWGRLCDEYPDEEISWEVIPHVYGQLSQVQHRMGKHADARDSLAESEVRRLYLELGNEAKSIAEGK